jgi:hypothetical protein
VLGHRLAADAPTFGDDAHVVTDLVLLNYLGSLGR